MSIRVLLVAIAIMAALAVGFFKVYLPGQVEAQRARSEYNRRELEKKSHRRPGQVEIDEDDPRLLQARDAARAHFSEFAASFAEHNSYHTHLAELSFPTADKLIDLEWITVDAIDATTISGTLVEEPAAVIGHHKGDRVTMSIDRVADWLVRSPEGIRAGNFVADKKMEIEAEEASKGPR
ncbi:MAG: DUF2314 domain-containing protein [Phycisphaerales bacterium]|jgi:uncharacterized protein YegJ (DUF2314 family)